MKRHKTVEAFIDAHDQWQPQLLRLRQIMLSTGLQETVKWGAPCYTAKGKNVVMIGAFKAYFGLWFYNGASLSDPHHVLVNAQEGVTRGLRQWRMTASRDIKVRLIKAYVREAADQVGTDAQIRPNRAKPLVIPPQLVTALGHSARVAAAFEALSKGKKREYADYIAGAKREDTKARRLQKILPMIQAGQGLNDRYRNG